MKHLLIAAVAACLALGAAAERASAGGAALRWEGQVTTDLAFSEFFNGSHTIMARFMAQYPRAYRGPILGVQLPRCAICPEGPSFELGMGTWNGGVNLSLEVAGNARTYSASIPAGVWQHVAVRRSNGWGASVFRVYLNGVHLCADAPEACDLVIFGLATVPGGTLSVGRTANADTGGPAGLHQFYGLVDDVAVYSTALGDAQIQSYASLFHALNGAEPGLLTGYTFEALPPSAKLTRPVAWSGTAYLSPFVGGAANPGTPTLDAKWLPWAPNPFVVKLPFAAGQEWKVTQEYAGEISHRGTGAFALDISRVDAETIGSAVYTPLGGVVEAVDDSWAEIGAGACIKASTGNPTNCNFVQIEVEPGFVLSFRHLGKNSVPFAVGDYVAANTKIATVGAHPNGAHLHVGARTDSDTSALSSVSVPLLFKNYKAKNGAVWDTVNYGVPAKGVTVSPL